MSSIAPLGNEISTAMKCPVPLPENYACHGSNGGATPHLFKETSLEICYFCVFEKPVKVMGQAEPCII